MAISPLGSGLDIINRSTQMADQAAREIANNTVSQSPQDPDNANRTSDSSLSVQSNTVENQKQTDPTNALIKLEQAVQYNQAGVNVLQKNQDMIGSLLDIRV